MEEDDLEEAISSIPEKKRNLQIALETLNSISVLNPQLHLQWQDLDAQFSATETLIHHQLQTLKSKQKDQKTDLTLTLSPETLELQSLFANMDAAGLLSRLASHRGDLAVALPSSPDPAKIVIDIVENFLPNVSDGRDMRTCTVLLDKLEAIRIPKIAPLVRNRAKKLAERWKAEISRAGKGAGFAATAFLQLVAAYRLAGEFDIQNSELQLCLLSAWKLHRKHAFRLVDGLGLRERIPEIIQNLIRGRKLAAVKFIYAFEQENEFPPVPLLKAYLKDTKKMTEAIQKKRDYSTQSQREAVKKEIEALRSVIKMIRVHNLESEYPSVALEKRMADLNNQRADKKKQGATVAASRNSKNQKQQKKKQWNNSLRPSTATLKPVIGGHPYSSLVRSHAPSNGMAGSFGTSAWSSIHKHAGPNLSITGMDKSSLYSMTSLERSSVQYDMPVSNGYRHPGFSRHCGSSLYP